MKTKLKQREIIDFTDLHFFKYSKAKLFFMQKCPFYPYISFLFLDLGRENETQNENKNEPPERPNKRSRRQRHVEITLRDDSGHERHEKEVITPSTSKTKKKKKRKTKVEKETEAPTVDPPIDPNEPTYCLCDQVSYGEMIGCDNVNCEREWFHFSCVGLMTKPKGKWYCPTCRGDRSNQMRPKAV